MTRGFAAALFLAASFFTVPAFAAETAAATFEEANARYQKGDFKGAEEAYEKLLASGAPTAPRLYNLGNAAFRNGKKGKALLNYERALEISPRDADARWNVAVVQSVLTDRIAGPSGPLDTAVERIAADVSSNEAAAAFAFALALWALEAFAAFAGARGGLFGAFRALVLAAVLVSGVVFAAEAYSHRDPCVVVLAKEAVARYGPSTRETKAFVLHEGAEARVTDRTQDWVYVTLGNGSSGWIPREACENV
jgi:tetratricopeptide (TPR) repeat protein